MKSEIIVEASSVEISCGTTLWQSSNRKHAYYMINNLSFFLIAALGCFHGESWHLPPHRVTLTLCASEGTERTPCAWKQKSDDKKLGIILPQKTVYDIWLALMGWSDSEEAKIAPQKSYISSVNQMRDGARLSHVFNSRTWMLQLDRGVPWGRPSGVPSQERETSWILKLLRLHLQEQMRWETSVF